MNVVDEKSAQEWLRAWGDAPRKSLHRMAIESQQTCIALSGRLPVTRAGHVEAMRVLTEAWNKRYPEETLPCAQRAMAVQARVSG